MVTSLVSRRFHLRTMVDKSADKKAMEGGRRTLRQASLDGARDRQGGQATDFTGHRKQNPRSFGTVENGYVIDL